MKKIQIKIPIKRFFPKHLFGRVILIIIVPMVLVQLFTAYIFYERHWDTVRERMAISLAGDVTFFTHKIGLYPEKRDAILIEARDFVNLNLKVTNEEFQESEKPKDTNLAILYEILKKRMVFPFNLSRSTDDDNIVIDVGLTDGKLIISVSKKRLVSSTTYIFIFWMAGATVLLGGLAVWFISNQVKPIYALARAAEKFGKGQDTPNFRPRGASEVRQASLAFLKMRERITKQVTRRTEMLAAISHDLRTPLTRMKLQLEMMKNSDTEELVNDVLEMETMVRVYLDFAKGEGAEESRELNLSDFIGKIAEGYLRENQQIEFEIRGDISVCIKENTFKRCLQNLINNGVRYANSVKISAKRRKNSVFIFVDDDGKGIPVAKRKKVFEAFRRLEESRNLQTGGVGLGLTIARDIVLGHGGNISLKDSPMGGLRVEIELPV